METNDTFSRISRKPEEEIQPLAKEDDWKEEGEKEPVSISDRVQRGPRRKRIGEVVTHTPEPIPTEAGSPQALVQMGWIFLVV